MRIKLVFFVFTALLAKSTLAQLDSSVKQWNATVSIVDEANQAIEGAKVTVGYFTDPPPGETVAKDSILGLTDRKGIFMASHQDRSVVIGFQAEKKGYYPTLLEYTLGMGYTPEKWNPSVTLMLKRMGNPIGMFAKRVWDGPPANDRAVGYDLFKGDWVAPYGSGEVGDIVFRKTFIKKSSNDYDDTLLVGFSNHGDGIQEYPWQDAPTKGSLLKSPTEAPRGGYQSEIRREASAHPGQPVKPIDVDEKRIYLFRVRTILDARGDVKSALYGKIQGDFMQFTYYLNPTPNDRNLEFDPRHNLFSHLTSLEKVSAP